MTGFEPSDPAFAQRVRSSFEGQNAMKLLGAQLIRLAPGECDIGLPFRPDLTQQRGYFHGGIVGTIADSAGGYAAFTRMPLQSSVLTVEYKMNLLAPADGEMLVTRGRVVRPGRTLIVSTVDVTIMKDARETPCAKLLRTLITMHRRPDE